LVAVVQACRWVVVPQDETLLNLLTLLLALLTLHGASLLVHGSY
jgi:hypothetical protein